MGEAATFRKFTKWVWRSLPVRKIVIGEEAVGDIVMIAVQFWPVEALSASADGSSEQADVLRKLCEDVVRVMGFVWGEERYKAFSLLGVEPMIAIVISVIHEWWKGNKARRGHLNNWRRNWIVEE